jgi:hypothetical protein
MKNLLNEDLTSAQQAGICEHGALRDLTIFGEADD